MEIKIGKQKLLLPFEPNNYYWARCEKKKATFIHLGNGCSRDGFFYCCNCGHVQVDRSRYGSILSCHKCGKAIHSNVKTEFVAWGRNTLISAPKIISQGDEKSVSISLYEFIKGANGACRPDKYCEIRFSRENGLRFISTYRGRRCNVQTCKCDLAAWDDPMTEEIVKAFEKIWPQSGVREVVRVKQREQYGFNLKVLLNYMSLLPQYPYLEQLAKSGYGHLLNDLLRYSPATVTRHLAECFQSGTKEKDIVRLPSYVREFIKTKKDMNLRRMRSLFELCALEPNMSRETFESFRRAFPHYIQAVWQIRRMINGCDYSFSEVCRLVLNNEDKSYPRQVLSYQYDTVRMSRQMGIKYEKFPKHVQAEHDKLSEKYKLKRNAYLAEAFGKRVNVLSSLRMDGAEYIIRCPESIDEMVREGQTMHHCVASYTDRFAAGTSLIFFMRRAKEPDNPYITMEFDKSGRLIQARKAFNRPIDDREESDLIQSFRDEVLLPSLKVA